MAKIGKYLPFTLIILACLVVLQPAGAAAVEQVAGLDVLSGKPTTISSGKRGLVVVFLSARCPCSNAHIDHLRTLAKEFSEFQFVGVHANTSESRDEARSYFRAHSLPFPVVEDQGAKLLDRYGALKTPQVFVFSPSGERLYYGGVTSSHEAQSAEKKFLSDALSDLQAGRSVKVPHGRALGCYITRRKS